MDKELKAKWIEALRSGRYQQAKGDLKCSSGFCCLGVLLDVSARGRWQDSSYAIYGPDGGAWIEGELESYAAAFGLTNEQETLLIRMNDGKKEWDGRPQTFQQIADHIEKNL